MAKEGNPNSVSDTGVGALCARSAVIGAFLNVRINASGLKDKEYVASVIKEGEKIMEESIKMEAAIIEIVNEKIK